MNTLPPLPPPELLGDQIDSSCPACKTRLRFWQPARLGYTQDQMIAYATAAVAAALAPVTRPTPPQWHTAVVWPTAAWPFQIPHDHELQAVTGLSVPETP